MFQGKITKNYSSNLLTLRNNVKKRFIAGAICPKCKSMDTMSLTKEQNVEKVTCVSCGEQMTQPEEHVEESVRKHEQIIGVFNPE